MVADQLMIARAAGRERLRVDDLEPPAGLSKLTSIDAPFEAVGTAAVQRLAHRVANSAAAEPIHLLFQCRIIEGESTGAAVC